jgi:hypothetical protein
VPLSAAVRACRRHVSGDHLAAATPPVGPPWSYASIEPSRTSAGVLEHRRRRRLLTGGELQCLVNSIDTVNARVAAYVAKTHGSVTMGRLSLGTTSVYLLVKIPENVGNS